MYFLAFELTGRTAKLVVPTLIAFLFASSLSFAQSADSQLTATNTNAIKNNTTGGQAKSAQEQPGKPKTLVLHLQQNSSLISVLKAQVIEASFTFNSHEPKDQALKVDFFSADKKIISTMFVKPIAQDILQAAQPFNFALRLPLPANTYYLALQDTRIATGNSAMGLADGWIALPPLLEQQLSILDTIEKQTIAPVPEAKSPTPKADTAEQSNTAKKDTP